MAMKSRILVIGGTGYIGKFIIEGDLYDEGSLEKAVGDIDVVISAVGQEQLADQDRIISAIKKAGNIKRFFPSEFGNNMDQTNAVEPARSAFAIKSAIRRAIEAENIPYTYVSSNSFAGCFLRSLSQPGAMAPPRDEVVIPGDGHSIVVFNKEGMATYTIKDVDDPRMLNKVLYIKPKRNVYSFNEVMSLWENKIGKTLERFNIPMEQVEKNIQESAFIVNLSLSISHSIFVLGDQTSFEIDEATGVEASALYPGVKYTTGDEYLSRFV